jgi:hypothetical protein
MEKFDQPELHPRGFPLWVNILLVSALILAPIVAVALYQAWQDKQAASQNAPAPSSPVTQTESKATTADDAAAEKPAAAKVETSTETKIDAPAESTPSH